MKRPTKKRIRLTAEQRQKLLTDSMKDRAYPSSPTRQSKKRESNRQK